VLSAGGDKSYTGTFKHRVGERILFCHISRQVGARRSDGPCVFPVMHGARLDPPALRGRTTAHRFPQDGPDPGAPPRGDGGEGGLWEGSHQGTFHTLWELSVGNKDGSIATAHNFI